MISKADYEAYQAKNVAAIKELLNGTGTRPVLFLGCGITKRYLAAPSWMELLKAVANKAGITEEQFNFLSQKAGNFPADLGTLMVDPLHEWAWSTGKNNFPQTYFEPEVDKSIFLKHIAAECLKTFGPLPTKHPLASEIDLLKKLSPHAIITTNFDTLIEELFPDFECVIGERIIPMSMSIIGELYKVHGTVNDPTSLVLTQEDYERFMRKRRYISSKMMTYFAEYPVFIAGTDRNVTLDAVARAAFNPAQLPADVEPGFAESGHFTPPAPTFPNGVHVCEVEVDPETGIVRIERYLVVDDFGVVINPLLLAGQVNGGIAQGVGQAMLERTVFDPQSGQLLSGTLQDYALPRADDLPALEFAYNVVPCRTNPLGVKGAGEAGAIGSPPALMNAIVDALAELGIEHIDMPATPELVWRTIRTAQPRQAA